MTPEEVAQRNSERPGYRLIDYAEAALPAYLLDVDAVTLERKPLPVIEEFALKAVGAGLTSVPDVAGLLGIDERVMKNTLVGLARAEQVTLTGGPGTRTHVLKLTSKGHRTLSEASMITPQQHTFKIVLDGLTKSVAHWRTFDLIRPREVAPRALLEIPNMFSKRPTEADITIADVQQYISLFTTDDIKRDVLAIKSVERAERRYLPAIALFYLANHGDDIQVGFAIDGRLSARHEATFAHGGGVELLRIKEAIRKGRDETRAVTDQLRELAKRFPGAEAAASLAREVERRRADLEDLDDRSEELGDADSAQEELDADARKLQRETAVVLSCYQHPEILKSSLESAQQRLLIVSPWITPAVVNREFTASLRQLLERQVDVYIAYGLGADKANSEEAIRSLEGLAQLYPNFRLKRVGNTHSKVLIRDDDICVVTSFNWLSFKGDPNRTIRDERGMLVRDKGFVDQTFKSEVATFFT